MWVSSTHTWGVLYILPVSAPLGALAVMTSPPTLERLSAGDTESIVSPLSFSLRLEAWMDQYRYGLVALIVVAFVAFRVPSVYGRPVWYDELATYYLVRTFSWSSICDALRLTADAQPPTYHFLQIPVLLLLGDDPRNLRWLTLLASCVSMVATFVWLRRTTSVAAAMAGVAMLAGSELGYYATEARPYALLIAAVSLALACRGLAWRVVWLAVAVSLHYYAFFLPLALAFTESSWRRRATYALALCPLAITLPAMQPTHVLALGGLFSASLSSLFQTIPALAGGSLYALEGVLFVAAACLAPRQWRDWFPRDWTLWALIAMLPICWLMGRLVTGVFFSRYAIVSLLGLAGLVAWFMDRLPHRAPLSVAFSLLVLGGSLSLEPGARAILRLGSGAEWDGRPTASLVDHALSTADQPVVMGQFVYLDVFYHLSPENRPQFHRLTVNRPSFTTEYAYQPGQTDAYSEMIGKYAGFTPKGADDWLKTHSSFTVVALDQADWILALCRQRGGTITRISHGQMPALYAVQMPAPQIIAVR